MSLTLYGIAGCDTVRKARRWLDGHGIDYQFHDYKKHGIDAARLGTWCEALGWQALVNTRGTTWRKLDEAARENLDSQRAIALMQTHTSLIKRPLVEHAQGFELGFDAERYQQLFGAAGS